MKLSSFEKNQILKHLNALTRKVNRDPLDLFQKGQVFNYLNDIDKEVNPKLGTETPKEIEKEIIIKKEIITQEISDDKMKEIIKAVKSEITIKDGRDGKDAPDKDDLLKALRDDFEFIQQLKSHVPKWTGSGGGLGVNDVIKEINTQRPINPKMFGDGGDGTWRIRQDGDHLRFEHFDDGIWMEQGEVFVTNRAADGMIITEDNNPLVTEDGFILVEE